MGNDHQPSATSPIRARGSPNPSWGTITRLRGLVDVAFGHLLTPHGERSPPGCSAACRSPRAPNPSWGTITYAPFSHSAEKSHLLTPHGERSRFQKQWLRPSGAVCHIELLANIPASELRGPTLLTRPMRVVRLTRSPRHADGGHAPLSPLRRFRRSCAIWKLPHCVCSMRRLP